MLCVSSVLSGIAALVERVTFEIYRRFCKVWCGGFSLKEVIKSAVGPSIKICAWLVRFVVFGIQIKGTK